jgi:monoamine oxidase
MWKNLPHCFFFSLNLPTFTFQSIYVSSILSTMAVRMSDARSRGFSNPLQPTSHESKNGSVIIVGAGAAGMYAAHLLAEKGGEIVVLEARETHGGRIRPLDNFADFPVELGAEQVHGQNSIYYKIIEKCEVSLINEQTKDYYFINGQLLDKNAARENKDFKKAMELVSSISEYEGADISLLQYIQNQGIDESVWHIINAEVANEHGTSAERIGMLGLAYEAQHWEAGEENLILADRSHLSILEEYFKDILRFVEYTKVVKSIDYTGEVVKVSTQDGGVYEADAVLITVPISILKGNALDFFPALPPDKLRAISKIGMDAGMKVMLKFKKPFWEAQTGSIYGQLIPEYWVSSEGKSTQSHIITAFVHGKNAEYLTTQGASAITFIVRELDEIFGNSLASTHLQDTYIMDWSKETFIKGTYSYDTVGIGDSRKVLAQPVQNIVFFAGEATCTNGHHASIHGALESAERAVAQIWSAWEKNK